MLTLCAWDCTFEHHLWCHSMPIFNRLVLTCKSISVDPWKWSSMQGHRKVRLRWPAIYTCFWEGANGGKRLRSVVCSLWFVNCNPQATGCKLPFCFLLTTLCWICLHVLMSRHHMPTPKNSLNIGSLSIVSDSGLLAFKTILCLLRVGIALGPAAILFIALSTLNLSLALSLSPICCILQAFPSQIPSWCPCIL